MVKREFMRFFSFDRIYTFSIAHSAPTLRNKQNMAQNPPPTKHHRRVVDYCSDEEEEDEEFVIEEELNKLSALIETSLANAFGFACCDDWPSTPFGNETFKRTLEVDFNTTLIVEERRDEKCLRRVLDDAVACFERRKLWVG